MIDSLIRIRLRFLLYGCCLLGFVTMLPSPSQAAEIWLVLPFRTVGLSPDTAIVFQDLLKQAISSREDTLVILEGDQPCSDLPCSQLQAEAVGAERVIYGDVSSLGKKVFVSFYLGDATGRLILTERMTGIDVDELGVIAERMAEAIITGRSIGAVAALGNITEAEARVDTRRQGDFGGGLTLGVLRRIGGHHVDFGTLLAIEGVLCYETPSFSLENRIGYRFDTVEGERHFREFCLDLRANYILSASDIAPYLGIGAGIHYLDEKVEQEKVTGTVVKHSSMITVHDHAWAPSLSVGGGVIFLRTYTARFRVEANYNVSFVELNGHSNPQAITLSLGIIF